MVRAPLAVVCLALLASPGWTSDEPAAPATAPTPGLATDWSDLDSPWYAVRRQAVQRLVHLPPQDGLEVARALLQSAVSRFRLAGADWLLHRLEHGAGDAVLVDVLVAAAVREDDPTVAMRLVHAGARSGPAVGRLRAEAAAGRYDPRTFERLLEARLLVLFESVMHEDRIPGFFDGQFTPLHALDETAYVRILRIAWDARVSFVIRSLAVMALHEPRHPGLLAQLRPLLVHPSVELDLLEDINPWSRMEDDWLQRYLVSRLSQYARFSLAKAGIPAPIDEKIAFLQARAAAELRQAEQRALFAAADTALLFLDDAMELFFELGYHYQQLDRYVQAELQYRVITERPEPLRVKRWAHYNLACIRALQGRKEEALAELEQAMAAGFTDVSWARRDGDLASLRDDPRFHRILDPLRAAGNRDGS